MATKQIIPKALYQLPWFQPLVKTLISTLCALFLSHTATAQDCTKLVKRRAIDSCQVRGQVEQLKTGADAIATLSPSLLTARQLLQLLQAAVTLEDWTNDYLKPCLSTAENRTAHYRNLVRAGGYYEWSRRIPDALRVYNQANSIIPPNSSLIHSVKATSKYLANRIKILNNYTTIQDSNIRSSSDDGDPSSTVIKLGAYNPVDYEDFRIDGTFGEMRKKVLKNKGLSSAELALYTAMLLKVNSIQTSRIDTTGQASRNYLKAFRALLSPPPPPVLPPPSMDN